MVDVYIFCEQVIRSKVLGIENLSQSMRRVLDNDKKVKLKELINVDHQGNIDQFVYIAALVLIRACEEAPLGFEEKDLYLPYFDWFKKSNLEYSVIFDSVMAKLIETEIKYSKNVQEIVQWLELVKSLKDKYEVNPKPNLDSAFFLVVEYVWLKMQLVMRIEDEYQICRFLENIKIFQDLEVIGYNVVSVVVRQLFRSIDNYCDIEGIQLFLGNRVKFDIEKVKQIVCTLKNLSLNYDDLETLKKILDFISMKEAKNINKNVSLDLSLLIYHEIKYTATSEFCDIFVWHAEYLHIGNLAVKQYKAKFCISKMAVINLEANILEALSKISGPGNCFLKFYGRVLSGDSIYLITEFVPYNLMSLLSEFKRTNTKFPLQNLQNIVKQLLNSFSIMHEMNIYHQDIRPHNFLINSERELKIVGFRVSENYNEVNDLYPEGKAIQGANGYEAPEICQSIKQGAKSLSFNIEKAQVYSLGLVFLQIVLLEDVSLLSKAENYTALQYKINNLNVPWLIGLLRYMLCYSPQDRRSFRELFSMVSSEYTSIN